MSKITPLGSKSYLKSSSCARTGTGKMRMKKSQMLFCSPPGVEPQTIDEWKLLIQLSQRCSSNGDSGEASAAAAAAVNGSSWSNGSSSDCGGKINPESLTLLLARMAGPDRATQVLEECGVQLVLSPHSRLVCELLRVAEKRQRWVGVEEPRGEFSV